MSTVRRIYFYCVYVALSVFYTACGGGGGADPVSGGKTHSPPSSVAGFVATAENKRVTVRWDSASNATEYEIRYSADPAFTRNSGVLTTNSSNTYTLTGLTNGVIYYFSIRSVNAASKSAYSPSITATPGFHSGWNIEDEITPRYYESNLQEMSFKIYSRDDNLNSNRNVLTTWVYANDYDSSVYAATYSPLSEWRTPEIITTRGGQARSALSDNGDGLVAWAEKTYLNPDHTIWRYDIFVKHFQDGAWLKERQQMSGSESGQYPGNTDVAVDHNGNAVLAWQSSDGMFYARTYDKANNAWSANLTPLNSTPNNYSTSPQIKVDDNGVFVAIWSENKNPTAGVKQINLRKYSNLGGWTATEPVNTDDVTLNVTNHLSSFDVNDRGEIFVLWIHSSANGDDELLLKTYTSTNNVWAWNSVVPVDRANFTIEHGEIVADNLGNAALRWNKKIKNNNTIEESLNLSVYDSRDKTLSPIDATPNYEIPTIVCNGNNSFRTIFDQPGATHVQERSYDSDTKTWRAPVTVLNNFGHFDYIATSNSQGVILLTTSVYSLQTIPFKTIVAAFYMP